MSNFNIPSSKDVTTLLKRVKGEHELTPLQNAKLRHACYKTYVENQGNSFDDMIVAARIYLGFILENPQLEL